MLLFDRYPAAAENELVAAWPHCGIAMPAVSDQLLLVHVLLVNGHLGLRIVSDHCHCNGCWGEAFIGMLSSEVLPQDDAKCIDISGGVIHIVLIGQDLRNHPVDAALLLLLSRVPEAGEAKVADLEVPLVVKQEVEQLEGRGGRCQTSGGSAFPSWLAESIGLCERLWMC